MDHPDSSSSTEPGQAMTTRPPVGGGDSAFHSCLCPAGVCQPLSGDGIDWQSSECETFVGGTFGWVVLAVALFFGTFVFPCCFYCARWWCHCCGGRYATKGCCCTEPSTRTTFRGYTNRTILAVKIGLVVLAAGCGVMYGQMVKQNNELHPRALQAIGAAHATARVVTSVVSAGQEVLDALQIAPELYLEQGFVSQKDRSRLQRGVANGESEVIEVENIFEDLRTAESDYRRPLVERVPIVGLVAVGLAVLCGAFNMRKVVGLWVGLLSVGCAAMVLVVTGMGVLSVANRVVCDNMEPTVLPVLVATARANRVCGDAGAQQEVQAAAAAFAKYLQDPQSHFCQNLRLVCSSSLSSGGLAPCTLTPCLDGASYVPPAPALEPHASLEAIAAVLDAVFAGTGSGGGLQHGSILDGSSAGETSSSAANSPTAASAVEQAAGNVGDMLPAITAAVTFKARVADLATCSFLEDVARERLTPALCGHHPDGLLVHLHRTSSLVAGVVVLLFASLVPIVLGMKRFRSLHSYLPAEPKEEERAIVEASLLYGNPDGAMFADAQEVDVVPADVATYGAVNEVPHKPV